MSGFHIIIPARYASSRLPAKALADIAGQPMVVRVAERARAAGAHSVHVATDHDAIAQACRAHGIAVLLTDPTHRTGTDRLAEAVRRLGLGDADRVVNVQGDEPLVPIELIGEVADALEAAPDAAIATACHRLHGWTDFQNPNVVKVVLDARGYALYFSRAPIPWPRDRNAMLGRSQRRLAPEVTPQAALEAAPEAVSEAAPEALPETALETDYPAYRHVGMYAYRVSFLKAFGALSEAPIERHEALEQLRALWHGYRIKVVLTTEAPPAGVDTAADLARVRAWFDQHTQKE